MHPATTAWRRNPEPDAELGGAERFPERASAVPTALSIQKSSIVGLRGGASSCGSNWDVTPVYGAAIPYPASNSFVIDAGGAPLPADWLDLDGDGNVAEPLPVDFDGNPRVSGARSDLGAIEVTP